MVISSQIKTLYMKSIFKYTLLCCVLAAAFVSCGKDKEALDGPPSISRVATSINHAANISNGDMNQWILIIGNNLKQTQSVFFSDLEVPREDIYASDTLVSVRIPRKVPAEVTNKVKVVTKSGEASYDFVLNTPAFAVKGLRNEHTPAGDTLEIMGDFFDLYFTAEGTEVNFAGGVSAPATEVASEYIKVKVPAGAEMGPVTVQGPAPLNSTFTTNGSWYLDTRNMIIVQPVVVPATGMINSHPDYPKNPGLMMVKQGSYAAWGWDAFFTSYLNWPAAAMGANKANYVMKFEMNTKLAVTKGDIIFNIADYYYRWPYNYFGKPLDTKGKWETITLPMDIASHPTDNYAWFGWLYSDGESRESNFAISNFRVVPKN